MGANIKDVLYKGIWHNQTVERKFEVPGVESGSLSTSGLPEMSHITLEINERLLAEQENKGSSHTASPFWEITEYTTEEINAIREADKLDPDLAEHYKDLLED